jgi:hypothetical protein
MKRAAILLVICLITGTMAFGQVAITTDNSAPDNSAMLDVKSTTKGFLAPRMTFAQRNAIVNPATGLMVICTNCNADGTEVMSMYLGGKWQNVSVTCDVPLAPSEGTHIQSNTQIIWNWNAMPIATGYKWSATSNYATATNMGTATTKTETGLTTGNVYTRYVWAYNVCGHSDSTIITGLAMTCGEPFAKMHIAGAVAPVSKTVTYGTVTNIPGEASKCWITSNLGADHQATGVNDATEASAGWYWKFNRKQGFKHTGSAISPGWSMTTIDEDVDWEPANDPCRLELGVSWRIPTYAEWFNVDAGGGWANRDDAWDSDLKMHAAGYLINNTVGTLADRGLTGIYWTSTQTTSTRSNYLYFSSSTCTVYTSLLKDGGIPLRCLRK